VPYRLLKGKLTPSQSNPGNLCFLTRAVKTGAAAAPEILRFFPYWAEAALLM